jgi:preprotein translocase subunit YajC
MTCGIAVGSEQKASMSRIIQLLSLLIIATAGMAADGGPAPASTPTTVPGTPGGVGTPAPSPFGDSSMFILIGGMILFMWLLVIRPQKKEEKRRKALIDSMKPGHQVVTIGGVHGEVVSVGELTVELNVTKGDKPLVMTFNRGAIATNVTLIAADAKPAK